MISMVILLVAISMLGATVAGASRQKMANRERMVAAEAARSAIERMRNEAFSDIYSLFNGDSDDDPAGPGSAPGRTFGVRGLQNAVGTVTFPERTRVDEDTGEPFSELREDVIDRDLGMPRDLNGDGTVDELDHEDDYITLPVRVGVSWTDGAGGNRSFVLHTLLTRFVQ